MLINLHVLQSVELDVHFNIYFLYLANTFISEMLDSKNYSKYSTAQNHQPQNIFKPPKKYGSLFNQTITFPIRLYNITFHFTTIILKHPFCQKITQH
jgi:hypothetical protein